MHLCLTPLARQLGKQERYAVQDKVWITGLGDKPWEVYVVKGDTKTGRGRSGSYAVSTGSPPGHWAVIRAAATTVSSAWPWPRYPGASTVRVRTRRMSPRTRLAQLIRSFSNRT